MIYLAGSCSSEERTLMVQIANALRTEGYEVYAPFELKIENAWDYTQEDWAKLVFESDIKAIKKCDVFVLITPGRNSTAGTNWEQGYAYALNKKIVVAQITDTPTSLMTYCGCNQFINTTRDRVCIDILVELARTNNKHHCKTVLT